MDLDPQTSMDVETVDPQETVAVDPFQSVPAVLRGTLQKKGFDALTEVQQAVLASDADGRDLRISSQTGSGKTVALGFAVTPLLLGERGGRGPDVLVIVPTRELAAQVSKELHWLLGDLEDVFVASVTGGTPIYQDKRTFERRPRVLVGTPGRLVDHITNGNLDVGNVMELVLDEADQMLDMGFREELEQIVEATPSERRTHMVSATFPAQIRRMAERYQNDAVVVEGTALGEANENIEHIGHLVNQRDRYVALVNHLLLAGDERTLVFVERRADASQVATMLHEDGFRALPLSGELAQSQRDHTISAFRAGRATILVATDVAARGLDIPEVTTVIHTSPPIDPEVYTHRSGRTGRAGKQGKSILLAPPNRRRRLDYLLRDANVELTWAPVPGSAEIQQVVDERSRAALDEQLTQALEADPTRSRLEHAQALLESNDPARLVAVLLGKVAPGPKVKAKDLQPVGDYGRTERRPERAPRPVADITPGCVRFFINWGATKGADPSKILAVVCRRGGVTGDDIGAIHVHPNASTFDVREGVVRDFEPAANQRDEDSPSTIIRRDRGPMPSGGGGGFRRRGGGYRRRGGGYRRR